MHWRNKYDDAPERFRHKYFPEQDPDKLYGDIEPSYHGSARNVYECFGPEVKLLFLVRQPSLATFSYYKMLMRRPRHYRYVRYYQGFHRYSVKLFTKFANEEIYTERKDRFQYDKWINEYLQYFLTGTDQGCCDGRTDAEPRRADEGDSRVYRCETSDLCGTNAKQQ